MTHKLNIEKCLDVKDVLANFPHFFLLTLEDRGAFSIILHYCCLFFSSLSFHVEGSHALYDMWFYDGKDRRSYDFDKYFDRLPIAVQKVFIYNLDLL
jgi:hypothetical protein